jgi:hypothetical protein
MMHRKGMMLKIAVPPILPCVPWPVRPWDNYQRSKTHAQPRKPVCRAWAALRLKSKETRSYVSHLGQGDKRRMALGAMEIFLVV